MSSSSNLDSWKKEKYQAFEHYFNIEDFIFLEEKNENKRRMKYHRLYIKISCLRSQHRHTH